MRITDIIHDALIKLALVAANEPYRLTVDKTNQIITFQVGDLPAAAGVCVFEDEDSTLQVINECIKRCTPKVARNVDTCRMVAGYDYELISIIRALNDAAPLSCMMDVEVRADGRVHIEWDNSAAVTTALTTLPHNPMRALCFVFRNLLNHKRTTA